ncbi:MAG TPA: hydrogenase maturation protease, partial [Bacteroidota bacterium]|nr:hydrogenase maturation protease [Bacteroidota bacterium]
MRIVVAGIGNEFRGDDGAGLSAARLLRSRSIPDVEIHELNGEITRLVDILQAGCSVVLIDATRSPNPPGTILRIDVSNSPLPPETQHRSTHGIGLSSVIELAHGAGNVPSRLVFYGIEGESFDHA